MQIRPSVLKSSKHRERTEEEEDLPGQEEQSNRGAPSPVAGAQKREKGRCRRCFPRLQQKGTAVAGCSEMVDGRWSRRNEKMRRSWSDREGGRKQATTLRVWFPEIFSCEKGGRDRL